MERFGARDGPCVIFADRRRLDELITFLEMNDVDGVPRWSARTRYVLSVYILGGYFIVIFHRDINLQDERE